MPDPNEDKDKTLHPLQNFLIAVQARINAGEKIDDVFRNLKKPDCVNAIVHGSTGEVIYDAIEDKCPDGAES